MQSLDTLFARQRYSLLKIFIVLMVLIGLGSIPALYPRLPTHAAGNNCNTSGPVSAIYTVTLCITAPVDGATVSGLQTVSATAPVNGTNPGIAKLIFYLNGQYLLTDYQNLYTFTLPTVKWVDGSYVLEVEALMKDGFTSQRASITLTFNNGIVQPPINNNTYTTTSGTTPPAGQSFLLTAVGDGADGATSSSNVTNLIASWNPNLLLYLGDVYEDGSFTEFYNWYGTTSTFFGQFRSITNPVIGNHEYGSGGVAPGYFDYWDNVPNYYSYDAAGWHFIALDSNCGLMHICAVGQAEYQWLQNDLSTHTNTCTIAYYHHPVFNVGSEGYTPAMNDIWALLAQNGVDIVLNGHDHDYQRWVPLDGSGQPSSTGITEFVTGVGGHGIQGFITNDSRMAIGFDDTAPNSFGALRLQLNQDGAGYQYFNTSDAILDYGSVACSGAPADITSPNKPTNLTATAINSHLVNLTWTASTDNVGVTGYDIFRNGVLLTTIAPVTSYDDTTVQPQTTYIYRVRARDAVGKVSSQSSSATITTPGFLFSDDFESGNMTHWMGATGLIVQQQDVHAGQYAARATSSGSVTYAYEQLTQDRSELYYRIWFKIISQGANSFYLQRFRTSANGAILGVFISSTGKLSYRNEVMNTNVTSTTTVTTGIWHELQTRVLVNSGLSGTEIWLDGVPITALNNTENLGSTMIGRVQLGESTSGRTYDVILDDVALSANFIDSSNSPTATPTSMNTATFTPSPTNTATFTPTPTVTATSTPTAILKSLDPAKISFQEIASGLNQPVFITNASDGSGRMFFVEQPGRIRIQKNGALLTTPFLDIQAIVKTTGSEQGLLSLAFDPAYATNGNFYVVYTAPRNGDSTGSNLVLEKFSVSTSNPDQANPNSGVILLTISHPVNSNHNGGTLVFGQDGYLYWSTGDGGSGGDPPNNAQQTNNLLGKILRIDVHSGSPYGIPANNPFSSSNDPNVKKEIWAYGLRNPWRLSFDRLTHNLYIGDVGQNVEEEVDFQAGSTAGGQNYGWHILEGNLCYTPSTNCVAPVGYVPPVTTYDHGVNDSYGCAITGGYVYRGTNFPSLYGFYFYGDYCSGRLFSLYKDPTLGWQSAQLLDTPYSISTFGEDQQGELYVADYATGKIYNIHYQESFHTLTGNAGIGGATLRYTDGTIKTMTADGSGNYSITVPLGWSGTVTPYKSGYTFTPLNKSYNHVQSNQTSQDYVATACAGCANVQSWIGGGQVGAYTLGASQSQVDTYALSNGPVEVKNTNSAPVIAAERVIFAVNGMSTSYSELMGLPKTQLATSYLFPWYNNQQLNSQLRFGNVGTSSTVVSVKIHGVTQATTYTLAPGESTTATFGVSDGPVEVFSDGQNIIAAERVIFAVNNTSTSYSELMGLPKTQLATSYLFPWYNNQQLNSQLRFGNVGTSSTIVSIKIHGTTQATTYTLAPGESTTATFPVSDGPVEVFSDGQKIIAAERVIFAVNNTSTSYSELMGLPKTQLATSYLFPWYNNQQLNAQLRFGNVGSASTIVSIKIHGTTQATTYTLAPGESMTATFPVSDGPVEVFSDGQKIIAAERVIFAVNNTSTSYSELMGLPKTQAATSYLFPWYNNLQLNSQLRFAVP